MQLQHAYVGMTVGVMIFACVVSKVIMSWVSPYDKPPNLYWITGVKIAHLKQTRALAFSDAIGNACDRGVVAVDRRRVLRMIHLGQGKLDGFTLFDVHEEFS